MSTRSWSLAVALATAMALGISPTPPASAAAGEVVPSINAPAADAVTAPVDADFSLFLEPNTELPSDPQPGPGLSFTGTATADGPELGPPHLLPPPSDWSMSRATPLNDSPMAPLPPAVVAGPVGIAFATFIAWRAKRRGGRI